jgi:hypothetical protein
LLAAKLDFKLITGLGIQHGAVGLAQEQIAGELNLLLAPNRYHYRQSLWFARTFSWNIELVMT